ncbi:2-hydroxyacylsphingosine 1-beta-galactosyltransferase-like [Sitophilus oryzae]|uniref:UDP-glucuronosyltransferase n=1 Tax=Sitophilus oryzae TaxID=7048 RepID=A0A6J2X717_SITOR|nr:2-hydroxyacylsphingosine 1-beta-galactosyltransferase-like [Sitophilus oryzae]
MKLAVLLIIYSVILNSAYSLKLLIVFPVPARSHYILGNGLSKGLANLGHEVTFVAPFSEPNPPKTLKQIVLKELVEARNEQPPNMFEMADISPFFQIFFLNGISSIMIDSFLKHPEVQELLHSNEKFDAVILEQFMSDALTVLAHHYNAPLIVFSTIGPNRWVNNLVANPEPASYVPDIFLSTSEQMTFAERAYNLFFTMASQLNLYYIVYPRQKRIAEKYFPGLTDFEKIHTNVSLVLLNSHESISQPVPHVPNMIDIGGYHVQPSKALPKDLQDFMDSAKEGVIYFSMGSNLVPSLMPTRTKNVILKVLGSRKEKVLWKWDEDQLENKPANVKISKWFPQQDILAHPNCKLFITHGGLLSTTETVTMGVPVLAFPIFGDQKLNARRAQSLGFGKSLEFSSITEEELASTLNELLSNPKYKKNAKLRSQLLQDRPVKPIELADYWIKYVVRYGGAPHLRVAGIRLPFYKYWFLDVVAVFGGGFVLSIYVLVKLWKYRKYNQAKEQLEASSKKKRQ